MTSVPGEPATKSEYPDRWEERWATGSTGWDQGRPHAALLHLLEGSNAKGDDLGVPRRGRALVPGCGRGYDLPVFAERGLHTVGLDISETGAAAARRYVESQTNAEGTGKMEIRVVDFFKFDGGQGFDLIYDYTFLCALPPDLRPDWSRQITSLARRSTGTRLITLIFPIDGNPGGPPYSLDMATYHSLLDPHWDLIHLEDVPTEWKRQNSPPGGEKLGVWKLKLESSST